MNEDTINNVYQSVSNVSEESRWQIPLLNEQTENHPVLLYFHTTREMMKLKINEWKRITRVSVSKSGNNSVVSQKYYVLTFELN
ncbi:MAG: hypothetical protein N4J56_007691 [Chroococcidiopsis sp. SAG 2025]|nr:hypothetical protein [Chroococcidiopsis sp. SAG 2025]